MKSTLLFILSFFLLFAILYPPIGRLLYLEKCKQMVVDFYEEETQNEQNAFELTLNHFENNILTNNWTSFGNGDTVCFNKNKSVLKTSNTVEVTLPPPKI